MNNLDILNKKYDIIQLKLENAYLAQTDSLSIFNESIMMESDMDNRDIMVESVVKDAIDNLKKFIDKIIEVISSFFKKIFTKEVNTSEKEAADKIDEVLSSDVEFKAPAEKVNMYSTKEEKDLLDKYIQEVSVLERDLIAIAKSRKKTTDKAYQASVDAARVMDDLAKIDAKYDDEWLKLNEKTIKMAKKDALRFSRKQLETVRVDYNKVESNSKKILQGFKKDAEGVEHPVVLNCIQKICNGIATRVRKHAARAEKKKKYNLKVVMAIASAAAVGTVIKTAGEIGKNVYSTVPQVKNTVDDFVIKHGTNLKTKIVTQHLNNDGEVDD